MATLNSLSTTLSPRLVELDPDFASIADFYNNLLFWMSRHMPGKIPHMNAVADLYERLAIHRGYNPDEAHIRAQLSRIHDCGYLAKSRKFFRSEHKPSAEEKFERKLVHTTKIHEYALSRGEHQWATIAAEQGLYHHEKINGSGPHDIMLDDPWLCMLSLCDDYDGDQRNANKPGVPARTAQEAFDRLLTHPKYQGAHSQELLQDLAAIEGLKYSPPEQGLDLRTELS